MELDPLGTLPFEDRENGKKDEKNKRRKRGKFAAPIPLIKVEKPRDEKAGQSEASALDKAVAELALKKRAEAEAAAKEKAAGKAETPQKPEALVAETTAGPATDTKTPAEKSAAGETDGQVARRGKEEGDTTPERPDGAARYELLPTDLNGGEVIIHLQGNASREERILPLAGEDTAGEPPTPPSAENQPAAAEAGAEPLGPATTEAASPAAAAGGGEAPPPEPPETPPPAAGESEPPEPPQRTAFTTPGTESSSVPPIRPDLLGAPFDVSATRAPAETSFGDSGPTKYESGGPKKVATQKELDDAVYYATKTGQNRGVVAGLVVGGGLEHWRHHRREKKQAKVLQQQDKKLQEIQTQQTWQQREHNRRIEELQHTAAEAPRGPEALRPASAIAAGEQLTWPGRTIEQPFSHAGPHEETGQAAGVRRRATTEVKRSAPLAAPEEQPPEIPHEHRLQTSAWHSIEVDARTGKPVERPTFEYGHEYYRERAQEAGPKEPVDAAAGEAALVAAALASSTDAPGGRDGANQPMLPPSAEAHVTPQVVAKQRVRQAGSKLQTGGPIWPWAVALVVVVFLLIAALR